MTNTPATLPQIIAHAKEYGFVFASSEIYDGLSAVYDFGPNGVQLKNNIKAAWWRAMTQLRTDVVGLDSAIFMHPEIWKASGHVDHFSDPLIDNKDSKKRYRVDHLIEGHIENLRMQNKSEQADEVEKKLNIALAAGDLSALENLILREKILCPVSKTSNWSAVRQFNLMFSTQLGSIADEASTLYLRPETAQGIFVNFLNVQKTMRMKVPFGIAQIGKAFRNEIIARQFIFRMREFEQMEMQFFIPPGEQPTWFAYWRAARLAWHETLGITPEKLRTKAHQQLSHYADAAEDIEYEFPFGWKEVEGIHSRTDYDLSNHEKHSGKKLSYFDPTLSRSYLPYIIETSVGVERVFLMLLCHSYCREIVRDVQNGREEERVVLRLPYALAPYKIAILPLVKKDGLSEIAQQIHKDLQRQFMCYYDEKDSIGKRYRRQDAVGTPFCATIDYTTKDDHCVTLRDRDAMTQVRVPIAELASYLMQRVAMV